MNRYYPQVIGLVGPIRAGKSTVASVLESEFGYKKLTNSEILKEILCELGLDATRNNMSKLGDSLFSRFGNDLLAKYQLQVSRGSKIVIDGIRYVEEVKYYRAHSNFKLLSVESGREIRYQRTKADSIKSIKDSGVNEQIFKGYESARSEVDLCDLIRLADSKVINDSGIDELAIFLERIMLKW